MTSFQISDPSDLTPHAALRMHQRRITAGELQQAAADAVVRRQDRDHLQVFGRNGITFITDRTGRIVVTVVPRNARPLRNLRPLRRPLPARPRPPRAEDPHRQPPADR